MNPRRVIIDLHSLEPLQASWVVIDPHGNIEHTATHSHLDLLPPQLKKTHVTLIVPAQDVVLTAATLPKLNRQKLLQALPFALEDQLIDDIHDLHFAAAEYQSNEGILPVAIVAKNKMDAWLALCKQFDIHPIRMISRVFTLPFSDDTWYLNTNDTDCTVRTGRYSGFGCDKNNLQTLIDLSTPPEIKTENIDLTDTNHHLPWINLLQGHYQIRRNSSEARNTWLIAGYAALAWIGIAFLGKLVSFLILHHEANLLEAKIGTIYKKHFPQASSVVAPRQRMETKLKAVTDEANKNYFLVLLAKMGKPLSESAVQLHSVDFRDDSFTLEISATAFDDIDDLVKKLSAQNLLVKQQNAAVAGNQVKASLIVERGTT